MQKQPRRRSAAAQRKRLRRQRLTIIKYALIAVVVFAAAYWLQLQMDLRFGADVFYAGTYVNGVALEGKTYEEAEQELNELSSTLLNGAVFRLYYGDREWTISTADIGAKLDVTEILDQAWSYAREGSAKQRRALIRQLRSTPIVLASTLEYDQSELENFAYAIKAEIDVEPVNASVTVTGFEQLSVSQSQTGLSLDAQALINQLVEAMTIGGSHEIELQPVVSEPEYTTQELQAATQKLSGLGTSTAGSSTDRTYNIRLALSNFNGLCVPAGATISFNDTVGKRSPDRGYRSAAEYAGTSVQVGYGGGVCQASSTLYVNLIYSGLEINERSPHNMTVAYTKPSLDAAVADDTNGNPKDLKFTNNTDYPIYIFTSVDSEKAYVSIWGKPSEYEIVIESEVLERDIKASSVTYKDDTEAKYAYYVDEAVLASTGKTGMRSQAWRYFKKDGEIVTTERLSVDYYQPQKDVYWRGVHSRTEG